MRGAHPPLRRHARAAPGRRHDPLRASAPIDALVPDLAGAAARAAACGSAPTARSWRRPWPATSSPRRRGRRCGAAPDLVDQVAGHARAPLPRSRRSGAARRRAGGRLRSGRRLAAARRAAAWCCAPATVPPMAGAGSRRWPASVPVLDPFDRAELGGAVGRDEVVHVGLAAGGLARAAARRAGPAARLSRVPHARWACAVSNAVDEGTARP